MAFGVTPSPFQTGKRLIDGSTLNTNFGHPVLSSQDAVTATPSGNQTTAYKLTTRITRLSTVGTAADSVQLIASVAGKVLYLINDTATSATVYGSGTDTINGVATATGVPLPAKTIGIYFSPVAGKWFAIFQAESTTGALALSSGSTGTFVANGASAVTVTNANLTANSVISYGINTIGGTPAGSPFMATATPGTGFTVKAAAGDTSTYNYAIIG